MTKGIFTSTVFAIMLLTACNKGIENSPQVPPPLSIDTATYLQLTVSGVQLSGVQHYSLVSIESNAGQPVITNKKLTVEYIQGVYKTDKIRLGKGEFRVSKFIILNSADTAVYAAPLVNTARASGVTVPLPVTVNVNRHGVNTATVQVLKLNGTESPASFGYTVADFGFHASFDIKVKLKINVGSVVYDSLPGKLVIDATNGAGEHWMREVELAKGVSSVRIPEDFSNYHFEINKWNVTAQRQYNRQELQPDLLIQLEATRQPKKLIQEFTYIENAATLVPESRSDYYYNTSGKLSEIKFYQKLIQVSGLHLNYRYNFSYDGQYLDSINRYDANNVFTGFTAFTYSGGRITNMHNKSYDQQTGAAVEYSGSANNEAIEIDYLFSNGNSMNYKIYTRNGNKVSDQALTSTGGGEGGAYEYDYNINPKHQLGYHDLYFTNYSKNNLTKEQKGYGGAYPQVVPYKFEYIYDNDGYPAEAYTSYKGFSTQQHLYRIKRVYVYQ